MKKILFLAALTFLSLSLFSQQSSQQSFIEQSLVVNVEVPVRVFNGSKFIDNLTIKDFEVFEDGIPQKIEAVYLVKKRTIERSDEKKRFSPETSRSFFLFFEVSDYMPKLGSALDYLFQDVILPGDELFIVTPIKTYRLKERALIAKSSNEISSEIKGLLRKDALAGNSEYRSAVKDLAGLAKSLSAAMESGTLDSLTGGSVTPKQTDSYSQDYSGLDFDEQLILYESLLNKLEILRKVDQLRLLDFANFLKNREGQKYVFLFHQREFIPQIESRILNQFINMYQSRMDVIQSITGIFDLYKRDISFDVNQVKQVFADSSISIHFLFITKPPKNIFGLQMQEHSEDIYSAFKEMALATGGFTESSANPSLAFKRAVEASENYYLLYYSPKNYAGEGKFREIKVRVKGKDYRVIHRAGYFDN